MLIKEHVGNCTNSYNAEDTIILRKVLVWNVIKLHISLKKGTLYSYECELCSTHHACNKEQENLQ